ncbi:hypothetical protein M5689_023138 [Euphorbia peplus]|nr:hypothetical protein M5689_023138 [Euphorbia peplus]
MCHRNIPDLFPERENQVHVEDDVEVDAEVHIEGEDEEDDIEGEEDDVDDDEMDYKAENYRLFFEALTDERTRFVVRPAAGILFSL